MMKEPIPNKEGRLSSCLVLNNNFALFRGKLPFASRVTVLNLFSHFLHFDCLLPLKRSRYAKMEWKKKRLCVSPEKKIEKYHQGGLIREYCSLFKPRFYPAQFFASHAHTQRVHSAALARYRLHCILMNRRGNERQLHCLRFLCPSRQVDCARKNRQQSDLYVLVKSLVTLHLLLIPRPVFTMLDQSGECNCMECLLRDITEPMAIKSNQFHYQEQTLTPKYRFP